MPALLQPNHVYNDSNTDFTYLGLNPLVWLTVTCHLSVITACVPTLKPLFDSLLGNTMGLKIDGLYELRQRPDGQGFNVAEVADSTRTAGTASSWRIRTSSKLLSDMAPRLCRPVAKRIDKDTPAGDEITTKLRLRPTLHSLENHAQCIAGEVGPTWWGKKNGSEYASAQKEDKDKGESIKGLTDGMIMVRDDVEMRFDEYDGCSHSSR